jgi:hypothetical protein
MEMVRKVRWSLTRADEIVGSGLRFKASGEVEELLGRARREAAAQAQIGDRLTVVIDGAVVAEEIVADARS